MKRLKQYLMIGWIVTTLIISGYAYVHSIGINRTYGSNSIAGWGMRQGANDPDTYFVKVNVAGGIGDSVVQLLVTDSTKALKIIGAGARVWGGMTFGPTAGNRLLVDDTIRVTKRLAFTGSAGELYLPADAITNTMTAAIESTWIIDGSIGHASIKDGGVYGSDLANGYVIRTAHVLNNTAMYDSVVFTSGTGISLSQGANNLITITNTGSGRPFAWSVDTLTTTYDADSLRFSYSSPLNIRWGGTKNNGVSDTAFFTLDTTTYQASLKVSQDFYYINDNASTVKDTNIASDAITEAKLKCVNSATDEYALTFEATTGDFEWQLLNLGTINWVSQPFELDGPPSMREANGANLSIYYWMSVDSGATTIEHCVKHTNTTASNDLADTVTFSGIISYVAGDSVAIDSITFNFRASSATVGVASIKPILHRNRTDLSPTLTNYTGSATATSEANAWSHQAITSGLGSVRSKDRLSVWFVVTLDATTHNLYHDTPIIWAKGIN